MTLSHWFKDTSSPVPKTGNAKNRNRVNQLDNRIGSILLESNPNPLLRQMAGGDKSRITRSRRKVGVPQVYELREAYDRNRRQKVKKLRKSMHELRQFRSHPVPNFDALHKRMEERNNKRQKRSMHRVTEPMTPGTLLKSQESRRKWKHEMKKRKRELDRELTHQPNLSTKSGEGWRRPPFVPRICSRVIKAEPFQLRSVERGKQRKQFDMWTQHEQHSRWQHKAIEWHRRYIKEYRQARQQTNFKARPVPWKIFRA